MVRLDPEVAAAAEHLRRKHRIGLGEAVNELTRAGLDRTRKPARFRQRTAGIGLKVDVTDVAETLELLDQYDAEGTRWSLTPTSCATPSTAHPTSTPPHGRGWRTRWTARKTGRVQASGDPCPHTHRTENTGGAATPHLPLLPWPAPPASHPSSLRSGR